MKSSSLRSVRSGAALLGLVLISGWVTPAGAQTGSSTSSSSTTTTTLPATTTSTTTTSTTTTTTLPATTSTTTSTTTTTLPQRVPAAPASVAATVSGTAQVTVTWQPPVANGGPVVTGYSIVEVAIQGSTSSTSAPIRVSASTFSQVFNDRRPGLSYAYYVRAQNSVGDGVNSPYTAPIVVPGPTTTLSPPPSAPTNQTLTYLGNGQLRVTWTPPTTSPVPVASYRLVTVPSLGTFNVSPATLQITINGARAGVAYLVQIASVSSAGSVSPYSITNTVAIALPATVPLPPTSAKPPVTAAPPPPPQAPPQGAKPLPVQPPTPPGKPKPCISKPWPKSVYGRPSTFTTGAPQGVYIWHDGRYFQIRVYNPGPGRAVFTGTIRANTKVTFWATGTDRGDSLRRGRSSAKFAFASDYDIDGIRISASCATALTFDLQVNGVPVAPQNIFIGPSTTSGGSVFSLVR